jgi:tetratricopeptide (TPR) repeat protein
VRVLILGSDYLAPTLSGLGLEVFTCGPQTGADLHLDDWDPDYDQISKLLKNKGIKVDASIVSDNVGNRQLPTGLWAAPGVTVFYGVDSPLNRFWQMPYARLFDLAFVDQRQEAADLARQHPQAHWLPVAVDPALYEGEIPARQRPGVCFVGVVDPRVRPKRSAVLEQVSRRAQLTIKGGRRQKWYPTQEAAQLYRSYQLVLNENLFPGVTTRPLEGMASGGVVLSEAAPGDMDLLFKEHQHLGFYGPEDLEQKLELYLRDEALRQRVREQGRELVRSEHGLRNRAQEIVNKIKIIMEIPQQQRPRAQKGEALRLEGEALLMAGLRWPAKGGPQRLLRAAGRLAAAFNDGAEPLAASRAAGLAQVALDRPDLALVPLDRSAELGNAADRLTWGMAAWMAGRQGLARQIFAKGGGAEPRLSGSPGQGEFHLGAAKLLQGAGRDMTPGFTRRRLAPPFWGALEHLLEAVSLDPDLAPAWEMLGDVMLARGAAIEAHPCFQKARALAERPELAAKEQEAARKGYLS